MARINVIDEGGAFQGWFDRSAAERFDQATYFDGSNHISRATGSQWLDEILYRTAGGRWVLERRSRWGKARDWRCFLSADEAREWLLLCEHDEAVERLFGPVEPERGPGRPEVGPAVHLRLPEELLARVRALAAERGASQAETLRELVARGLAAVVVSG